MNVLSKSKRQLDIHLYRCYVRDTYIIGQIFINDEKICDTFEPSFKSDHPCIPFGSYRITLDVKSPKFYKYYPYNTLCNGNVPRLLDVPNRDGILIHCGNGFSPSTGLIQTQGCILVGDNTVVGGLTNSVPTFIKLYKLIQGYDKVNLSIFFVPCDSQSLKYVSYADNYKK